MADTLRLPRRNLAREPLHLHTRKTENSTAGQGGERQADGLVRARVVNTKKHAWRL